MIARPDPRNVTLKKIPDINTLVSYPPRKIEIANDKISRIGGGDAYFLAATFREK